MLLSFHLKSYPALAFALTVILVPYKYSPSLVEASLSIYVLSLMLNARFDLSYVYVTFELPSPLITTVCTVGVSKPFLS